jgi:hypothetical protein
MFPLFCHEVRPMTHSSHPPIVLTCLSFILITGGVWALPLQHQRPSATARADETFVVSGTLVRDDDTPIARARVMIAEAKDAGYAINIGGDGVLQNPSEVTDAKGRFSITVKRSLFKERREFVVVVPLFDGTARPIRLAGDLETVTFQTTTKEYQLGKIARDNPAVR